MVLNSKYKYLETLKFEFIVNLDNDAALFLQNTKNNVHHFIEFGLHLYHFEDTSCIINRF